MGAGSVTGTQGKVSRLLASAEPIAHNTADSITVIDALRPFAHLFPGNRVPAQLDENTIALLRSHDPIPDAGVNDFGFALYDNNGALIIATQNFCKNMGIRVPVDYRSLQEDAENVRLFFYPDIGDRARGIKALASVKSK